jgi:hypothetical protein
VGGVWGVGRNYVCVFVCIALHGLECEREIWVGVGHVSVWGIDRIVFESKLKKTAYLESCLGHVALGC